MTRRFERLILSAAILVGACTAEANKAPADSDLRSGKADGTLEIIEEGPLPLGESVEAVLEANLGFSWTVTVDAAAELSFETSGDEGLDTIINVQDAEGNDIGSDDDGGENYFSNLRTEIEAGTYTVVVTGYGNTQDGTFALLARCTGGVACGEEPPPSEDPWAGAKDVNLHHVEFTDATPIPVSFRRPDAGPVSLSSAEWWQRWDGGATQSFSWNEGTDYGKRCSQASAIRLEALWNYADEDGNLLGREAFEDLLNGSGWRGTMYNWAEDVSEGGRASFDPASMWAWRTGAIKWISVTRADGSCDLPTLDLLQRFSATCLERAGEDGEIQGCRASHRD
ncbi:MAG: hypothetical protein ACI9KE_004493 [Polyangiales bacterium]|jgi:hypothetical protein